MLPRVSRTFALNIRVLTGDLYRSVLLGYLLCRILDTIEDAPDLPAELKRRRLLEIAAILREECRSRAALDEWIEAVRAIPGNAAELDLLAGAQDVIACLGAQPAAHQTPVYRSAARMAEGMAEYVSRDGDRPVRDEEDLDAYCYAVAGTVGEMLTALFELEHPGLSPAVLEVMRVNAVSFGLGLQITNVAKDFALDGSRGVCFVPSTYIHDSGVSADGWPASLEPSGVRRLIQQLSGKALGHLDDALAYTLAIPRRYWRLRLFCAWPLWMAVASLCALLLRPEDLASGEVVKISRDEVRAIVRRTSLRVWSNGSLRRDFESMRSRLRRLLPDPGDPGSSPGSLQPAGGSERAVVGP